MLVLILPLGRALLVVARRSLLIWRTHHLGLGVHRLLRLRLLPILRRNRLAGAYTRRRLLAHHSLVSGVVPRRRACVVLGRSLRILLLWLLLVLLLRRLRLSEFLRLFRRRGRCCGLRVHGRLTLNRDAYTRTGL